MKRDDKVAYSTVARRAPGPRPARARSPTLHTSTHHAGTHTRRPASCIHETSRDVIDHNAHQASIASISTCSHARLHACTHDRLTHTTDALIIRARLRLRLRDLRAVTQPQPHCSCMCILTRHGPGALGSIWLGLAGAPSENPFGLAGSCGESVSRLVSKAAVGRSGRSRR